MLSGDRVVGFVTSGGYGHRLKRSFGMGYLTHPDGITADMLRQGRFEVEVACRRHPVEVQFGPWFDPKGERPKA